MSLAIPDWLSASLASDACGGRGVMPDWIRPLGFKARVAGYVSVATVGEDDNLFVRRVAATGPSHGPVLVIGGAALSRTACLGGLIATALARRGFTAVITDGLVRDVAELREGALAVWCRGCTPRASHKDGPGSLGLPTLCAGVGVSPGDFVIADEDGVVVWPGAEVETLLRRAQEKATRDAATAQRIAAGGLLDEAQPNPVP
jgi:regulator of RNase E activity RraA